MKRQTIQDGIGKALHLMKKKCYLYSHGGVSSKNDIEVRSTSPTGSRMIVFLLFIGNVLLHTWALRTQARPGTDEGLHLYQAKLMVQGYMPYKDFGMPSHVPFLLYLNGLVLKFCNFDIFTYHVIYTAWVFFTIFPLFYTVLHFTRSRLASTFSVVLFSTFAELVQWDMHLFALRQGSLPFFACFIYFFFVKKKETLSQIFLSLFSFCLITNFLISLTFVLAVFLHGCIEHRKSIGEWIKKYVRTYWVFVLFNCTYFGLILLIPGSMANFAVQSHIINPYLQRVEAVLGMMPLNWPIFVFGTLGIFFFIEDFVLLSLLTIVTFLIPLFVSGAFGTYQLTVIAVPFAIMGGIFLHKILLMLSFNEVKSALVRKVVLVRKIVLVSIILFSLYQTVYSYLSQTIVFDTTPNFFQTVRVLEHTPEPLFTLQPIYGLYAHKDLVMHYNVADMRVFRVMGTNLSYEEYHDIIERSNTVLLESFADQMLPQAIKDEIFQNYDLTYSNGTERVYVKEDIGEGFHSVGTNRNGSELVCYVTP